MLEWGLTKMITDGVVASACDICMLGCGVLVHLREGKPIKVEGDPDYPVNKGVLCPLGMASLEILNHPDRLAHPLKRVGERGSGKWQRISWDEALDTIAAELAKAKKQYGAESVTLVRGGAKGYQDQFLARFAHLFGTPNIVSTASLCHIPRVTASEMTYGFMSWPDYEYPPACMVLWGVNPAFAYSPNKMRRTEEALKKGSKLIVIDPAETRYAQQANLWVKVRPSSDLALALGMMNVIISEHLYDQVFVDKWTIGFEKLKAHVRQYTIQKASEMTWVPAETIREVARVYATSKPAIIDLGNGVDQTTNNFQCARAVAILRAITGNLAKPGGEIEWSPSGVVGRGDPTLNQREAIAPDVLAKRISLLANDGILPSLFFALPHTIRTAILEGKPYPIRVLFFGGANWLHTYSNAKELRNALESLDFLVVSELFMNPLAELADIVLPVGTYLETNNIKAALVQTTAGVMQKVTQVGDCWSDYQIFAELAKRLGLGQHWWKDEEECLDYLLKPTGLTFEEFRKVRVISGSKVYKQYEKRGFGTPSGKVELYSKRLEDWGFDPLPVYREPPETPFSEPELAKEYPLIFTSGKLPMYKHSFGRQIASLRAKRPTPLVTIHKETAAKLGIAEGDWVYIEAKRGKIRQKATLSNTIDPRVVLVDFGWWFPERGVLEDLHGWAESNINVLTGDKPHARETGAVCLRGILCKVYRAS
jgi:anaerobic selenocysteine-containing dehydrogenase